MQGRANSSVWSQEAVKNLAGYMQNMSSTLRGAQPGQERSSAPVPSISDHRIFINVTVAGPQPLYVVHSPVWVPHVQGVSPVTPPPPASDVEDLAEPVIAPAGGFFANQVVVSVVGEAGGAGRGVVWISVNSSAWEPYEGALTFGPGDTSLQAMRADGVWNSSVAAGRFQVVDCGHWPQCCHLALLTEQVTHWQLQLVRANRTAEEEQQQGQAGDQASDGAWVASEADYMEAKDRRSQALGAAKFALHYLRRWTAAYHASENQLAALRPQVPTLPSLHSPFSPTTPTVLTVPIWASCKRVGGVSSR